LFCVFAYLRLSMRLCYTSAGSGPALVFLHGFTGCGANWDFLRSTFAPQFRMIAVDVLGHGRSPSPAEVSRYTMEACIQDLEETLTALDVPQATVVGYSMGGRVALSWAAAHPERVQRLILESASPGLATPAERAIRIQNDEALAAQIETHGLAWFVDHWENIPLFASQKMLPEATRARLRAQRLRNNALGLANSLRGLGTGAQPALWDQLGAIHIPITLLTGELDAKFTAIAAHMAQQMPQARSVVAVNVGHAVHVEAPEWFAQWLLATAMTVSPHFGSTVVCQG
jgi:2-succinyl-6-hydroxy-2,4-cyclohexadiene-1-carboxylate synthase